MGASRLPKYAPQPLRRAPINDVTPSVALQDTSLGFKWPWQQSPRLADILEHEQNSFGVLRLMLALMVLVSHTFFLASGSFEAEPLVGLTGYSLGQYGVQGFFILSGLLVTQSLVTRGDLRDYASARFMRIFPALIVCVLATALIAGPTLSFDGARGYFLSTGWVQYIVKTLSLSTGSAQLPGLFALNPAGGVVNQSLWTLKYEVACYLIIGGLAGLLATAKNARLAVGFVMAAWAAAMLWIKPGLASDTTFPYVLAYFALFFGTGAAAYLLRSRVRISWQPLPVLALGFVITWQTDLAEIASAAFLGYGLIWLATKTFGGLRAYSNAHDYSYGVYIYSFPVTQALLSLWPGLNLVSLMTATLGITLLLAYLSWELIERPALGLVRAWRHRRGDAAVASDAMVDVGERDEAASTSEAHTSFAEIDTIAARADVPAKQPDYEKSVASYVRHSVTPAPAVPSRDMRILTPWVPKAATPRVAAAAAPVRTPVAAPIAAPVAAPRPSLRRKPIQLRETAPAPLNERSRLESRIAKIATGRASPTPQ
jgi:peptidoglycan/LPS O-acetylase OafA/YrhL